MLIRKATLEDLKAIERLSDSEGDAVGWVMRPEIIRYINKLNIFVACDKDTVTGYLDYHYRKDLVAVLCIIVVDKAYRMQGIGKNLIQALIDEATHLEMKYILLKCPVDLPSNSFYKALGFELIRTDKGRKRELNVYQYLTKEYLL